MRSDFAGSLPRSSFRRRGARQQGATARRHAEGVINGRPDVAVGGAEQAGDTEDTVETPRDQPGSPEVTIAGPAPRPILQEWRLFFFHPGPLPDRF